MRFVPDTRFATACVLRGCMAFLAVLAIESQRAYEHQPWGTFSRVALVVPALVVVLGVLSLLVRAYAACVDARRRGERIPEARVVHEHHDQR